MPTFSRFKGSESPRVYVPRHGPRHVQRRSFIAWTGPETWNGGVGRSLSYIWTIASRYCSFVGRFHGWRPLFVFLPSCWSKCNDNTHPRIWWTGPHMWICVRTWCQYVVHMGNESGPNSRALYNTQRTKLQSYIVGTLGCVFIDNETHESGVTKCTTGEAWSAFSWHHSSVFHCQWTHNQVFLFLSHMLI